MNGEFGVHLAERPGAPNPVSHRIDSMEGLKDDANNVEEDNNDGEDRSRRTAGANTSLLGEHDWRTRGSGRCRSSLMADVDSSKRNPSLLHLHRTRPTIVTEDHDDDNDDVAEGVGCPTDEKSPGAHCRTDVSDNEVEEDRGSAERRSLPTPWVKRRRRLIVTRLCELRVRLEVRPCPGKQGARRNPYYAFLRPTAGDASSCSRGCIADS